MPAVPAFLDSAVLLAEPDGIAVDRLWWNHIQRQNGGTG
jgi:hypothetical protein